MHELWRKSSQARSGYNCQAINLMIEEGGNFPGFYLLMPSVNPMIEV